MATNRSSGSSGGVTAHAADLNKNRSLLVQKANKSAMAAAEKDSAGTDGIDNMLSQLEPEPPGTAQQNLTTRPNSKNRTLLLRPSKPLATTRLVDIEDFDAHSKSSATAFFLNLPEFEAGPADLEEIIQKSIAQVWSVIEAK